MGLTRLTEEHGNELFPGGMLGGCFPDPVPVFSGFRSISTVLDRSLICFRNNSSYRICQLRLYLKVEALCPVTLVRFVVPYVHSTDFPVRILQGSRSHTVSDKPADTQNQYLQSSLLHLVF